MDSPDWKKCTAFTIVSSTVESQRLCRSLAARAVVATVECLCDCGHRSQDLDELSFDEVDRKPPDCPCFMFRSRRSTLVKRLWKSRIPDKNETSCTNEMVNRIDSTTSCQQAPLLHSTSQGDAQHVKSTAQSMLKRLKEKHLEILIQAIESQGGERTDCVLLPKEPQRLLRRGSVAPHVLCCQVWRWPELCSELSLKRLPCCTNTPDDPAFVCSNPYHWSLRVPESPPPCYRSPSEERLYIHKDGAEQRREELVSVETGGTPTPQRIATDGSSSNSSRRPFWCNIAYWEHRQRVGRLFTVFEPSVNVFQQLPHGDGLCLGVLQTETNVESVKRTRDKIGFGLTLSQEDDGLWLYNRSEYPIFVNSPTMEIPESRTVVVRKVQPGYSLNIFDFELSEIMKQRRDPQFLDGPYDPNSIRISFAKGWGPSYSRQFITSCPCWIEVLLSVNR